ncbi:hypothetical protein [Cupriavidus gilardii]|uniref:hypothetical protein n=1 Tax=Cupriavidus gilardii TaxID=82541 RepID=UPI001580B360|nr:hypothetical protein [Cupriavidus gilardii]MCT9071323.1 hypothetical protein [Cupriavidus gilardii]MCT9073168.1 hypothetical protein [Cupriavidus gilardii]QKS60781.1 hypothetical protein FOB47_01975 [Cupriavidus gilardii]
MLQEQIDSAQQRDQSRRSATAKIATILGAIFSLIAAVVIVAGGKDWHMEETTILNGWLVPGTLALACTAVAFVITRWKLGPRGSAKTVLIAICLWLLCALFAFRYPVSFSVLHSNTQEGERIETDYRFDLSYPSEPIRAIHSDKEGAPGLWGSRTAYRLMSMRSDGARCWRSEYGCQYFDCEVAKVWWFAGAGYRREWREEWSPVPRSLDENCTPAGPAHMEQYNEEGFRFE